ncbi:ArsR/SmtB family transcription factor [Pediococcus ethanolidurans]|uniref:ArsR/SmtB family transcription factor n=1 Tax=Pediococcus ethanolidurans TaxID=319653 RepID=UPI001C1EF672|nr:metalloregulator ArsR/SmtB family transcription factor [Pediococcus ethanolidurans]MBU7554082.1 helix-turn-helix transcriptional regulator [Pediococcus ethanolidurans]
MNIEQRDQKIAQIFKSLAEPNRLKIIRVLYQAQREMTCGEVGKELNISKSTVSYHFKALRLIGLTNTRKIAQEKYLSINVETFQTYLPGFLETL